ncbi:hypothetical protein F4819DRAFT_502222 [Hypoxylon fuscum]|nr:hypothetical protein F4819DRAFT_502222 [Hypoxylon fuscum]
MIILRWAFGAIIAATTISAAADELQLFSRLLKRQEPGSPAYNCHDNCGQAIIQGRNSADWTFYKNSLTKDATPCGLSTTPLSGKQPDVGAAIPAGSTATSVSEATSSTVVATESNTGHATAPVTETASVTSSSSVSSITPAPTGTGSGSDSGNRTTTTSSAYVVTNVANLISSVEFHGALALGAHLLCCAFSLL